VHHRESRLVPDRVIAPDFGDIHLILRREPTGDIHRTGRNVQVKRRARPAEVRPLGHRLEVIDRLGRFHLYRPHQLVPAFCGREHEIRKDLDLSDPHGHRLFLADVRDDVMTTLESDLQQPNDAVVLQLLANRANQYRAHVTSTREKISEG
jgi:hypothetical protein